MLGIGAKKKQITRWRILVTNQIDTFDCFWLKQIRYTIINLIFDKKTSSPLGNSLLILVLILVLIAEKSRWYRRE